MRRGVLAIATALGLLVLAAPAYGSFHLMKITEVGNSGALRTGSPDYVELQMFAPGQNHVSGQWIRTYQPDGGQLSNFQFPGDVAFGDSQRTILVADSNGALGAFPQEPDFVATGSFPLSVPSDGGVCFGTSFGTGEAVDCVRFGAGAPLEDNPSPTGDPAPAIDLAAIHRTIAPNCPTLLEAADDTDDSATDFSLGEPSPRNNSATPTEVACNGPGGGLTDTDPPQTKITKGPKGKVADDTAKFRFKSDEPGSTFKCKVPGKRFKKCRSPKKLKNLDEGKAKFKVRAIDQAGNRDPTPAKRKFKVDAE